MDFEFAAASALQRSEPPILYVGTPVVLISTCNEDGSPNLAPMSSAFWLGWRGVLGLDRSSKTVANMIRTNQCVLNLPSVAQVDAVDRIALTTGSEILPPHKVARGYRFEKDKFADRRADPHCVGDHRSAARRGMPDPDGSCR